VAILPVTLPLPFMTPGSAVSPRQLRVLVLEDNPESRLLLRHLLRKDFDATVVASADDAIILGGNEPFDVALLDINLGEKRTGVDVLATLRGIPSFGDTPALACTAYALPGDREQFLEAGFADYVSKPFVKAELIALLLRYALQPHTA
jgi:CheY-like chemotaxis protein